MRDRTLLHLDREHEQLELDVDQTEACCVPQAARSGTRAAGHADFSPLLKGLGSTTEGRSRLGGRGRGPGGSPGR